MLEVDIPQRVNISDLKKMLWLRDIKFTESYAQFSMTPNEKELESCAIERSVWSKLRGDFLRAAHFAPPFCVSPAESI